jgi:hypothetical protein
MGRGRERRGKVAEVREREEEGRAQRDAGRAGF